jgi:hypothetical protein
MLRTCSLCYQHLQMRSDTARAVEPPLCETHVPQAILSSLEAVLGLSSQVVVPYDLIKCSLSLSSKLSTIKLP